MFYKGSEFIKLLLLGNYVMLAFGNHALGDWINFKARHGKVYSSKEEEFMRMHVFLKNHRCIEEHNLNHSLGLVTYSMKMNFFGDMTEEEFRTTYLWPMGNQSRAASRTQLEDEELAGLPAAVDWRLQGGVSPVKAQGGCGSCWAFAATGAIEAQLFRKTGRMVRLSEQNLLDCSSNSKYGNGGCTGGLMTLAYDYILENRGVDTEESYPYEGKVSSCRFKRYSVGATIKGYKELEEGNEYHMKKVVANVGPVSVGLEGSDPTFRFYHQGVYFRKGCGKEGVNHAALVVGYGTDDGQDFWLAKNSWGPEWGEAGYFRMARNMDNQCGIASLASYPLTGSGGD